MSRPGDAEGDGHGLRGGTVGLIMDYAAGGSVGQLVAGRGRLGPGETVTVLTPIAQALAYLHGQGFTHGDVSPGNVLFTAHGKPLLADLGVARMVADAAAVPDAGTEGSAIPRRWTPSGQDCNRSVMCIRSRRWAGTASPDAPPSRARSGRRCRCWFPEFRRTLAAALESGLHEDRRLRPSAAELAAAVHRSAVAAPVDLSVSVHPTVIPQLLTRRSLPRYGAGAAGRTATDPSAAAFRRSARGPAAARREGRPAPAEPRGTPARAILPARPPTAVVRPACRPPGGRPPEPPWSRRRIPGRGRGPGRRWVSSLPGGESRERRLPPAFPGFAVTGRRSCEGARADTPGPRPEADRLQPWMRPPFLPRCRHSLHSQDPEEAVRGLARLRSLAFSTGDFRLLDQVNVPASSAAVADGRISASLKESGRVLAGFTTLLTQVAD